jgi:glucokinase
MPVEGWSALPLEEVASGWAIENEARKRVRVENPPSPLLGLANAQVQHINTRHVALSAEQGDKFAWSILNVSWGCLAEAVCHVITLICPKRIVIGGGVSLMGEKVLFEPLRRLVAERVFKPFAGLTDIVPAALGEEVVVHGAIALARKRFGR